MQAIADFLDKDLVFLVLLWLGILGLIARRYASGSWKRVADIAVRIGLGGIILGSLLNRQTMYLVPCVSQPPGL
jgi:hypothetical protein